MTDGPSTRGVDRRAGVTRLLVVHHTVSPSTETILSAVLAGARHPDIAGVEVVSRPALVASALEVLEADGYLLLGPVNLGYLAGALKHFFDSVYYPCLDATKGRPYAAVLHAGSDASGALRALQSITTGLGWRPVRPPLVLSGSSKESLGQAEEVAATLAATMAPG